MTSTKFFAPRRQDRKENFFDPLPWRPLRLCERPSLSDSLNPKFNGKFQICLVSVLSLPVAFGGVILITYANFSKKGDVWLQKKTQMKRCSARR